MGLVLLGGASALAVVLAYSIGRFQGAGGRLSASAGSGPIEEAGENGRQERYLRLEVELASGSLAGEEPSLAPAREAAPVPDEVARVRSRLPAVASTGQNRLAAAPAIEKPLHRSLVSGPLLEGWYGDGQMHFRGHQVQTQEGEWMREGDWEAWHENGTLHELGAYRNDVEHGAWKWFYENGARMSEGQFVDGEKVGAWRFWHENGRQAMEGEYVDGERSGPWIYHHDNSVRAGAGSFENGQAVGEWTFWRADGSIDPTRTGTYADGELVRDR